MKTQALLWRSALNVVRDGKLMYRKRKLNYTERKQNELKYRDACIRIDRVIYSEYIQRKWAKNEAERPKSQPRWTETEIGPIRFISEQN